MKVRGARRKAKVAYRRTEVFQAWVRMVGSTAGGIQFEAVPQPLASHMIQTKRTFDGYGRPVPNTEED